MSWDPYLDLDHGVLRNRLGITDPDALAQAEAAVVALRIAELERRPVVGRYDLAHLQHVHFWIFQDVYPWAGQLRTVRLGKGGQPFCPPEELTARAAEIFEPADPTQLRRLDRPEILTVLTRLLADGNALHPFREGNGRALRLLLRQLAADGGWRLSWADLARDRNVAAAQAAHHGDLDPLRAIVGERLVAGPPGSTELYRPE